MEYSVLVVDDDEDDFLLLSSHVKKCQQNVSLTYAFSGEKAIQLLTDGLLPTLIIIDAQMPRMDGHELLARLMHSPKWSHIPIIVWTGAISADEIKRYYQAGANSLLLKEDAYQDIETFCRHWFKLVQLPAATAQDK